MPSFMQGTGPPGVAAGLQVGGMRHGLPIVATMHLTATAYGATAQDNDPYGAIDDFGQPLRPGDMPVDPTVIPLNTRLDVAGYSPPNLPAEGEPTVARAPGGAIEGAGTDISINGTGESPINNLGIQSVRAYILG